VEKASGAKNDSDQYQNILFICGGAFDGIDKRISSRLHTNAIGYSRKKDQQYVDRDNMLQYIAPQDLKVMD
jgi:ATP-dependent Clp protease ATP-binding subunit ClpX